MSRPAHAPDSRASPGTPSPKRGTQARSRESGGHIPTPRTSPFSTAGGPTLSLVSSRRTCSTKPSAAASSRSCWREHRACMQWTSRQRWRAWHIGRSDERRRQWPTSATCRSATARSTWSYPTPRSTTSSAWPRLPAASGNSTGCSLPAVDPILTLDNLANPVVAIRNALPFPLIRRLGLTPYHRWRDVRSQGWQPDARRGQILVLNTTAVMHCPRSSGSSPLASATDLPAIA